MAEKYLNSVLYRGKRLFTDITLETDSYRSIDELLNECEVTDGRISEANKGKFSRGRPYNDSVAGLALTVELQFGQRIVTLNSSEVLKYLEIKMPQRLCGRDVECYVLGRNQERLGEELRFDSDRKLYAVYFKR